jgi:hypothetical protein
MARQVQIADPLTAAGEIIYGTALYRLQDTVDNEPQDQESTGFYAGDIRDCCAVCESKDKAIGDLLEKVRGQVAGAVVSLPIADVKKLIDAVRKPKTPAK